MANWWTHLPLSEISDSLWTIIYRWHLKSRTYVAAPYYHLSRIAKIRHSLTTSVCKSLIHGLVTSRLDFGNAMLYGIADRLLHRLEMVQRSAARVVMQIRLGDRQPMSSILQRLHWLPLKERIEFNILVFLYKAIYDGQPV